MDLSFYKYISDTKPIYSNKKIRKDGDFYIFLSSKYGRIGAINKTSAFILSLCNGDNKIDDIVNVLSEKFSNQKKEKLIVDVLVCLRNLESYGLVDKVELGGTK